MQVKNWLEKLLLLSTLLIMTACASLTSTPKTDEEIVAERAGQRLAAILNDDIPGAWAFTTPAYRQRVAPMAYSGQIAGSANWTDASVETVSCEGDRCEVKVLVSYRLRKLRNMENTRPLNEVWIKVDDNWWIYHRR